MLRVSRTTFFLIAALGLSRLASGQDQRPGDAEKSLLESRGAHVTELTKAVRDLEPLQAPPEDSNTELVTYPGPLGPLTGYLVRPANLQASQGAVIFLNGGFPPGGGSKVWEDWSKAKPLIDAGLVVMYPTMRGDCGNQGVQESFYGEVDDVLAARDYLAGLSTVKEDDIYLVGHSTGATLAILVAEATDKFRAVFALGPVSDPAVYGRQAITYDPDSATERRLRAPIEFLSTITTPTFIIEGRDGNGRERSRLQSATTNPKIFSHAIEYADHFEAVFSTLGLIAKKVAPTTPASERRITADDLNDAYEQDFHAMRIIRHKSKIEKLVADGVDLQQPVEIVHQVACRYRLALETVTKTLLNRGYEVQDIAAPQPGESLYKMSYITNSPIVDAKTIDAMTSAVTAWGPGGNIEYLGWDLRRE